MSCYSPRFAFRRDDGTVVFKETGNEQLRVPCGECHGCRLENSKTWALRCRHEASCWDHNIFVTLTYDDAKLPFRGSLDRRHVQLFLKSLRAKYVGVQRAPDSERQPIRYFGCGEYGTRTRRPHYHLLLFNFFAPDQKPYGKDTYSSESLQKLWGNGSVLIGSVTAASAAYVAGYATKKLNGRALSDFKDPITNVETGEYHEMVPEFSMMSLKPAIGFYWYQKYKNDLKNGYLVSDGLKVPVPRFYQDKFFADFPINAEDIDYQHYLRSLRGDPMEKSDERLEVKYLVALAKKRHFQRFSPTEI